ncbi:hypothetical protein [Bacillus badius]|uniref:hypothetical protein n=1 Tax=Bacillus badius TaxID=1455 RepID=UPI0007B34997|nr:hypothetical protein [Bacillus badius]KZR59371.1 hypothetical protein A3781_13295 [Bacillus badius]
MLNEPLEKVAYSYWNFIYKYISKEDVKNDLESCRVYINEKFSDLPKKAQINSQVILFGTLLLERFLEYVGVNEKIFTQSDVDQAIKYMNRHL